MTLSRETMLELMALADGELEGDAKARAEALAAESEEAHRVVESMREPGLRFWLGETVEQRARTADGIADAVMEKLVTAGGQPQGTRARRSLRVVTAPAAVGAALAIAAAVAIYVGQHKTEPLPTAVVATSSGEGTHHGAVEVDEIDSVAHVSIFQISAIANPSAQSSVVVWVDDEPVEK
jgi:anti-sigma factor RsiW